MQKSDYKIHIIGAGVSGLLASKTLEAHGYHPVVLEATDRVGGRVKTDIVEGYQLDHGFQVLLDAYPKAQAHLNYDALQLQQFLPGAKVFKNGKSTIIGDPLRKISLLWPTVTSSVGSFSDKLKILRLNLELKKKPLDDIFSSETKTTKRYLEDRGFSSSIINQFFRPFFSGIFLESELKTSSRMFEFVYKMFGEGFAVLPKAGIGKISEQLKQQLSVTEFRFQTKVKAVFDDYIELADGNTINTHFTIIATDASVLIPNLHNQNVAWKSCQNLYFEVEKNAIKQPLIGLVADDGALINNIFFHNSLGTSTKGNHQLLSVTVVKEHQYKADELIALVKAELQAKCNIQVKRHLKTYVIPKALPDLQQLRYDMSPTETQLKDTIFLAGDYLLNGSLNAAMLSGERAAEGLIAKLEDGLNVEHLTSEYV